MSKINVCTLLGVLVLGTTMMSAQATRTWVSGVGDDANPCSRTAPCKTFAGAISKTAVGGEIDALDPGGFGALTITKSITIDGGGGQVASVLVAGTNGIVVAAGAGDIVVLRNLRFQGLRGAGNANAGLSAIRFISGKDLNVEDCFIVGFNNNGIDIALTADGSSAHIINTVIKNVGAAGVSATTSAGQVQVGVDNSQIMLTQSGVVAGDHSRVTISRSFIEHASSAGVQATSGSGDAVATVMGSELSFNGNAVLAGPGGAAVNVGSSRLAFNTTAFGVSGGVNFSYGNNEVHGNGGDGTFSAASPGLR
jgi:hypothetical protein